VKHVKIHLNRFLRRVRIHGGEFDTSARAMYRVSEKGSLMSYEKELFARADLRIVRGSTIERKQMSTKTTFKRIALVTVAALGFGVLSVVPSQAAAGTITLTAATGSASLTPATGTGETSTGALITVSSLLTAGALDTITVQFIATGTNPTDSNVRPVMTFIDSTTAANTALNASANGATAVTKYTAAESVTAGLDYIVKPVTGNQAQIVGASFRLFLDSATASVRKAGTYNYLVIAQGYSNGVLNTALQQTQPVTLTIAAAPVAAAAVPAAANAKAYIQAVTPYPSVAVFADSVTAGSMVAGTVAGTIRVSNFSSTDAVAKDTMTVVMTGVGYLSTVSPAAALTGRSFNAVDTETLTLQVIADGSSGTGTITITTAAGASFVKTVTFFDTKPAKATATVSKAFIKAGETTTGVFSVVVDDAAGNKIISTNAAVTAAPTDTATTVGGGTSCTYSTSKSAYLCDVKGLSATKFGPVAYTITATGTDTAKTKVTTTATVTFADNVATKATLSGPATATPGATVEYVISLTEKNGYAVADQAYGVNPADARGLFASSVVSGWTTAPFLTTESFTSVSGNITSKGVVGVAGVATGTWTLIGDGLQTLTTSAIDKVIGKTTLTASTEITNPGVDAATDAANEATDAANAATDAALAAAEAADAATTAAQEASDAVAALSETVTKLISDLQAQIKSLAAVVAKIAKKVKA